jgi:hypothetical protein
MASAYQSNVVVEDGIVVLSTVSYLIAGAGCRASMPPARHCFPD